MTLQASGQISMDDINVELGKASGTSFTLNDTDARDLAGKASGDIALSDFYGASNAVPPSFVWTDASASFKSGFYGPLAPSCGIYANSQYLLLASNGYCVTSPDGDTWTLHPSTVEPSACVSVAYGASKYVAVGGYGLCKVSTDNGSTWTLNAGLTSIFASKAVKGLDYGSSKFTVVGGSGCATSTDGVTWTSRTGLATALGGSSSLANFIVWNGTYFVVLGVYNGCKCATSPDGITWTARSSFPTAFQTASSVNRLVWTGSVVIALGTNSTNSPTGSRCATSPTGVTWTSRTTAFQSAMSNYSSYSSLSGSGATALCTCSGAAYSSDSGVSWAARSEPTTDAERFVLTNGSEYIAFYGYALAYATTNGSTWTQKTDLLEKFRGPGGVARSVCWGVDTFVAVGEDCATSPDGATWTRRQGFLEVVGNYGAYGVCVSHNGSRFVAITSDGYCLLSGDGVTWGLQSNNFHSVAGSYTPDTSIQVGAVCMVFMHDSNGRGYVSSSADGVTWSSPVTTGAYYMISVCYGSAGYVGFTSRGIFYVSTDGITWSGYTTLYSGSLVIEGVAYGNGVYVAVGAVITTRSCYTSTDGITWTSNTGLTVLGTANYSIKVTMFSGGLFVVVMLNGKCASSPDGVTWTLQTATPAPYIYAAAVHQGSLVLVGSPGTAIYST